MNELQIFNNSQFGSVRTLEIDGKPWFVGKDVADALGYSNSRDAINKHVDDEDKQTSQNATFQSPRGMTMINESGVICLILRSKRKDAKEFKRWITHDVIPSVIHTGGYDLNPVPIVKLHNGKVVATVRDVARFFNISIADIINDLKDTKYLIQSSAEYYLTRDGIFLTVNDPQKFKRYMNAFDEMERQITLIQQKPQQLQFQPKELISYMIEMRKVLKAADVSDDVIAKGFAEFSENQGVKLPKFFIEDKITEDMNIDKILEYGKTAKNPSYEDYVLTLSFPIKRSIEIKRK